VSLRIELRDVRKSFGPVEVLHGVSFALEPGRIVGLLGENGAGKSTLMKILAGYERASAGQVVVDGRPRDFRGPGDAQALGIVLIHQEFALAEDLTVAQNVFLGHELRRGWLLDDAAMRERTAQALARVGLQAQPDTPVRRLIVAEKQLVEIAKALSRQARVLIMDEPTATLTPSETQRLFALMAQLKAEGVTIIYISHKLDEVERITDEVVVLRDGRFIARRPTPEVDRHAMANLMVGREISDLYPAKTPVPRQAPVMLRVEDVRVPGWVEGVSFEVRSGEILGFAGLVGAGRTELFEGLLGLRPRVGGRVELQGRPAALRSPREAADRGLTYLSEDRKGKGLLLDKGLRENLTLMALRRYCRPLVDARAENAALQLAVNDWGIRTRDLGQPARSLSGGNQQKLALAKVMHPEPRVVVLDEPTRGVDIGAKRDIYFLVRRLADEGLAVIVISSELVELIGLCHRVAVMRAGRLAATVPDTRLNEEELIAHATGTR
jgi:ribose transport system ATP-binding protein